MVPLNQAKRVVIKLGTGVLTSGIGELDTTRIEALCHQVKTLRERGIDVILVSSGAVGLGMGKLGLEQRPKDLATQQACAAVGQTILINTWQKGFDPHGLTVAQILLTREDLRAKHRHNAVFNTVERLLATGAVPIVNENDTVSATEIKFGDNDTLSALVASVTNADQLFILSNIPGLIDMQGTGEVVPYVEKMTPEIEAMAQGTNQVTSVGGMVSKLSAAKIAHRAGCGVTIGSGQDSELFNKLLAGESVGTYFAPSPAPVKSHKRWIAIQDHTYGTITIDAGAAVAIQEKGKSLLSAGVINSFGEFEEGDVIRIRTEDDKIIAHGLASLDAIDLSAIMGLQPEAIKATFPELHSSVIVHRDHLVLLD
ncbi:MULTISPECIES: glutamate 5-kinase [unclassified Lentimonas]|uniref:glutamate 5-kinase n=1 Tax=unclassified Lentimonas TaxID=2630993 RepID=UPI00132BC188|nr:MULTISPECIES: glutamate 5-kinase [unclassified Lentimonas]CAA6679714.1 Glutamate 5-kinase (EC / RNA-binding C-terminal domain PUA [Lentimonas sp. CC4]CAA6683520.1 Glutamate 5-kinase (EC / RNA-binding C-terminal domain PUA [Lentimonas sp. CC6]CAA6693251.1 Glutamate 5-kinase (EC / RNA-binding C-terminal domain PUA [Lentimonas sp. CC10]CAA6695472.1 Glutamate 5-kinase (EC / RNA-binding C-terminal domain PUA [Lentimonas sp. CC19]CAA7071761.1 Glutamate 5-kinase (EC / RNA-binding C-terminal domain